MLVAGDHNDASGFVVWFSFIHFLISKTFRIIQFYWVLPERILILIDQYQQKTLAVVTTVSTFGIVEQTLRISPDGEGVSVIMLNKKILFKTF